MVEVLNRHHIDNHLAIHIAFQPVSPNEKPLKPLYAMNQMDAVPGALSDAIFQQNKQINQQATCCCGKR